MKYTIRNASLSLKGNTILDYINFDVGDSEHIGIVGRNGAGKTTFLKALIEPDMFEEGMEDEPFVVRKLGEFSIGYQSQITFSNEDRTLLEEIGSSFKEILEIEKKLEKLTEVMKSDSSEVLIKEYTEALDRYEYVGGYTYKKEYEVMIRKFGFGEEEKYRKISSFSGGERTKIAFIKLLLSKPDLLLLDEPTNHLDLEAIEWLEGYLKNYKGSFVVVSHDRMFLNNIVGVIYDVEYGKFTKYTGNYEFYERKKEEDYKRALKNYERQQKEIKRLHELYERFRNKPSKAAMALSKLKKIEMMDIIDKPNSKDERTFRTNLDRIVPSTKRVAVLKNVEVGYSNSLAKISLEISSGDKIGIIGANGTGKSTLLKTICGLIKPLRGSINYGLNISLGYFDQNIEMDGSKTVLDEFREAHPELLKEEARNALGSFLFKGDDVYKKIEVLSGGERVRLLLCKILFDKPNFLVLDEPTNHMDIVGKKRLEDILKAYKGTLLFVSHDRYFVKQVAEKLIVFENDGAKVYNYGYDEYMELRKREEQDILNEEVSQSKSDVKTKSVKEVKIKNTYGLKKELLRVETEMERLEKKKENLNEKLSDPNVFHDYEKTREYGEELKKVEVQLEELSLKWDEIANKMLNED